MPTLNDWGSSWFSVLNSCQQQVLSYQHQQVSNSIQQQFKAVDQEKMMRSVEKICIRLSADPPGDIFVHPHDKDGKYLGKSKVLVGSGWFHSTKFMFCDRYKLISDCGFAPNSGMGVKNPYTYNHLSSTWSITST